MHNMSESLHMGRFRCLHVCLVTPDDEYLGVGCHFLVEAGPPIGLVLPTFPSLPSPPMS
jgi:hypothetical protein